MALTLAEAAQETGLNRSTILRAIKSGKVSGARDPNGTWLVEPAELFRVFAPAEASSQSVPQDAQGEAAELRRRAEAAEASLAELKEKLAEMRHLGEQQFADMRAQRDAWQHQAERLTERLSLPKPKPKPKPKPRRWWWQRRTA
jgi:hypothetical protein